MNPTISTGTAKCWTASELRRLSPQERDAILEAAALRAEAEYLNNPELTSFEAFGKDERGGVNMPARAAE